MFDLQLDQLPHSPEFYNICPREREDKDGGPENGEPWAALQMLPLAVRTDGGLVFEKGSEMLCINVAESAPREVLVLAVSQATLASSWL